MSRERNGGREGTARPDGPPGVAGRVFDTALSNAADFIYTFDLEGRFTYVNHALSRLVAERRRRRRSARTFSSSNIRASWPSGCNGKSRRSSTPRDRVSDETPFTSAFGTRYYEYIFVPVLGPDGEVEAVAGSTRDITERREMEQATRRRAGQLQRLAEIATRINRANDVNSVIGVVTEEARNLIGARQSATSVVLDSTPVAAAQLSFRPPRLERTSGDLIRDRRGRSFTKAIEADERAHSPDPGRSWGMIRDGRRLARAALAISDGQRLAGRPAGRPRRQEHGACSARRQGRRRVHGRRRGDARAALAACRHRHRKRDTLRRTGAKTISARTSFWPCWPTSSGTRWPPSATPSMSPSRTGLKEHVDWSMDVITRQMNHLTRLIDDLLDVSRINRGQDRAPQGAVLDATPILDSAVATVRPLVARTRSTRSTFRSRAETSGSTSTRRASSRWS